MGTLSDSHFISYQLFFFSIYLTEYQQGSDCQVGKQAVPGGAEGHSGMQGGKGRDAAIDDEKGAPG